MKQIKNLWVLTTTRGAAATTVIGGRGNLDDEGIMGFETEINGKKDWVPAITNNERQLMDFISGAEHLKEKYGISYKILEFKRFKDNTEQLMKKFYKTKNLRILDKINNAADDSNSNKFGY